MTKNKMVVLGIVVLVAIVALIVLPSLFRNGQSASSVKTAKMGGYSMYPLFSDKDIIKINTPIDKTSLKRGDIVVFNINDPAYPANTSVKRIVAIAEDKIMISGGFVLLNGNKLDEPYLAKQGVTKGDKFLKDGVEVAVPANELFVLGDDRLRSYDSRMSGFVKVDDVWAIVLGK